MGNETHDFKTKLAEGKAYELELDEYFGEWFNITATDLPTDKKGIDRIFSAKNYTHLLTVQYKADVKAAETGNVFIELESVNSEGVPGWAFTCPAEWLVIYTPGVHEFRGGNRVYIISPRMLAVCAPALELRHKVRHAKNDGYESVGVCVPLAGFAGHRFVFDSFTIGGK